jgi:hypothetical protein
MGRPLPSPAIRICYRSISHRENDAELRLAAHHPRVAFRRFFERISFNHGAHSAEFSEAECVIGIGWCQGRVKLDHWGGDVESSNKQNAQTQAILCLECSDIQSCHDRLRALVEVKVTPIHDWSGRKAFRCVDIDGNILEIFESISTKQQISDQKL